jgi:hypothetical protein
LVLSKEFLIFIKIKNKKYMGSISNHYGDVANWVEKVINSCETPQQEISARKLLRLFEKRLLAEESELYAYYTRHLNDVLDHKFYSRIEANIETNASTI